MINNQEKKQQHYSTKIQKNVIEKGLTEDIIRLISKKRNEPEFLLNFRLKAYKAWKKMKNSKWEKIKFSEIEYNDITYYSAADLEKDEIKLNTFGEFGIPLEEFKRQDKVATDAIWDSSSVWTTYRNDLDNLGILFCSLSEGIQKYPEKVKKYLGKIVPIGDNYFSTLNSAVFTDGSFCYVPKNVDCPLLLQTYFRMYEENVGQFERTLIVVEDNSYIQYSEGCSAPRYNNNQFHAAVVEIVALDNASVEYATLQNWYIGSKWGQGGIYNFVTKRGLCAGINSKIRWVQVEAGAAITWKYPSCLLVGDNSVGEFYSVSLARFFQQADTGSKMLHIGKNTRSRIIAKGISAGQSKNSYRGSVFITKKASGSRNYSECDSLFYSVDSNNKSENKITNINHSMPNANTFPYISVQNSTSIVEHEASTSYMTDEQIFYFQQRGLPTEVALRLIVSRFGEEVYENMHREFEVESEFLINWKLRGLEQ